MEDKKELKKRTEKKVLKIKERRRNDTETEKKLTNEKKRGERKGDRKKFMKKEVSQREIETAYYSRGGKSLDFNGRLKQKKQKKWN